MSLAARRAASQLLDRPGPRVADTVRHLLGVQAQDAGFAALALRARIAGLTRRDIERAREEERSIVRTWAMRGTLHLIATEDLGWLLPLVAPPRIAQARTRLAALGVTDPDRAIALMEGALALEGPLDRHELTERVARGGIVLEGQARIGTIYLAALQGRFCCGPGNTFVLVGDWLPEDARRPLDRDGALRELARRYAAAHAPCEPEDLASWAGIGVRDARRAWPEQVPERDPAAPGPCGCCRASTSGCWAGARASSRCRRSTSPRSSPAAAGCTRSSCTTAASRGPGAAASRSCGTTCPRTRWRPSWPTSRASRPSLSGVRIGTSLLLIAVGAILAYAVDVDVPGIDIETLGAILFYVGLLGLVVTVGLELHANRRPRPPAAPRPRPREPERRPPPYDPVVRDRGDEPTRVVPRRRDR